MLKRTGVSKTAVKHRTRTKATAAAKLDISRTNADIEVRPVMAAVKKVIWRSVPGCKHQKIS